MLDVKKLLAKILVYMKKTSATTFTPVVGTAYSSYGGCYYEKYGALVHVHIGMSGLNSSYQIVYTMPTGFRPQSIQMSVGEGGNAGSIAKIYVNTNGNIQVSSSVGYCGGDIYYLT